MTSVTNELMCELLKKMNSRFDKIELSLGELKSELINMRGVMVAMQVCIHNIYSVLCRHDERLELCELAEDQAPFKRDE